MTSSQNDTPNDQPVPENIRNRTESYEDEIDMIDYFRVLWKRKYLIVLGSVLPALVVALVIISWPRSYQIDYIYDVNTDEKSCKAYASGIWRQSQD